MVSILDPQEVETICDPCCGTGGFLIKAFEHIREKIEFDIHQAKEDVRSQLITDDFDMLPEKQRPGLYLRVQNFIPESTTLFHLNSRPLVGEK
jgi:type I restriction enzyme M protein